MDVDLKLLESRAGFISILVIEINSRAINFADFLPINSCKKITLAIFNKKNLAKHEIQESHSGESFLLSR